MTKYSGHSRSCLPQNSIFPPLQQANLHGSPSPRRYSTNKPADGILQRVVEDFDGRSSLGTMDMTIKTAYRMGASFNWPHVWLDIPVTKRTRIGPTSPTTGSFRPHCSQATTSSMTVLKWQTIALLQMSSNGLTTSAPTSWVPQTCGTT